ncbi:hypothetical protein [Virgibacillus sp. YIM 98842]|uniref:hypothetical protein n=1 Tax=Virgibacillus sp. YIM 98842 TaxID=2663533 RepID=UPI0013DD2785|nr:hypothetical protein [Virgibacillus sp. YIM 98842]
MKKYVEIYGKQYEMEINKLKVGKYEKLAKKHQKLQKKLINTPTPDTSTNSLKEKRLEQTKRLSLDIFNETLGEGVFEEVYKKSGRSVAKVAEIAEEVLNYARGKKKGKYIE